MGVSMDLRKTILKQWVYVSWHLPRAITLEEWVKLTDDDRNTIREEVDERIRVAANSLSA